MTGLSASTGNPTRRTSVPARRRWPGHHRPARGRSGATTSSADPPGSAWMKLACLGDTSRRPQPEALQPAGVDQPSGRVPGRIGEHRPGVAPPGLVGPAPPHDLLDGRPSRSAASPGTSWWRPATTTSVGEPGRCGGRRTRAARGRPRAPRRWPGPPSGSRPGWPRCRSRGRRRSSGWRRPPSRARRPPIRGRAVRRRPCDGPGPGGSARHRPRRPSPSMASDSKPAAQGDDQPGESPRRPPAGSSPGPSTSTGTSRPRQGPGHRDQVRLVVRLARTGPPVPPTR